MAPDGLYVSSSLAQKALYCLMTDTPLRTDRSKPQSLIKKDCILLSIGLLLFFFVGLGAHPYGVPSEARYIEIPMQMVQTGDWVTPRLNGVKYFEKPPLFYWIQAAQIEVFGHGEFSGRLWTAIFMAALCLMTCIAGYRQYGRAEGILSALILATCTLGFVSSRIVLLDVPVSFFLCASLFAFMFSSIPALGLIYLEI